MNDRDSEITDDNEDDYVEVDSDDDSFNELTLSLKKLKLKPVVCFVINTIGNANNDENKYRQDIPSFKDYNILGKPKHVSCSDIVPKRHKVEDFLDKLENELQNEKTLTYNQTKVCINIGLNKMKSLKEEENDILEYETNYLNNMIKEKKYSFKCKVNGFFWEHSWFLNDKPCQFTEVQEGYIKSKKINYIDAEKHRILIEKDTNKAKIPFQQIRDHLRKHKDTREFVETLKNEFRGQKLLIYLCLIDFDTIDFNGIFGEYLRIVNNSKIPPAIMTTGYEYPVDEDGSKVFQFASVFDMKIRSYMNELLNLGTYFSERNMCVLIKDGENTVEEEFTDHKRGSNEKSDRFCLESPILISQIVEERENITSIFSKRNPIITEIPPRMRTNKLSTNEKKLIFSDIFKTYGLPNGDDIKELRKIIETHLNRMLLRDAIFYNKAVKNLQMRHLAYSYLCCEEEGDEEDEEPEKAYEKWKKLEKEVLFVIKPFIQTYEDFFVKLYNCLSKPENQEILKEKYDFKDIFRLDFEIIKALVTDETNECLEKLSEKHQYLKILLKSQSVIAADDPSTSFQFDSVEQTITTVESQN